MSNIITVVGAGTMGSGIAQVALEAGFQVNLLDMKDEFVERGTNNIKRFLSRKVEKGKLTQETYDDILSRFAGMTDMAEAVKDSAMVVEAVFEKIELKQEIFEKLDTLCPTDVILASNTSTLSITEIAKAAKNPQRVVGTHYFSPVPVMKLVEVIRGKETSDDVTEKTVEICSKFGKTPIIVKDIPGFIVNRFLCLLYNEAANMIDKGIASSKDIDAALKLGCNWPMGVCEIIDLAGVDVCGLAMEAMYNMTGEERYNPSPLFRKLMNENSLGRKTGKGFYTYES
jgi:3-hydroxybutyryl-CoA dehydrogenase